MEKKSNISASTPSKTWESIRNKLLSNNFSGTKKMNIIYSNKDLQYHLINENIESVDSNKVNRVNYN